MKRLSPSDMVALAAIAATILLIIVRRERFPVFVDIYYLHACNEQGGNYH